MSLRKHVMFPRKKMSHAGLDYPVVKAGSTPSVDVFYAKSLGNAGAVLAMKCLARCEEDVVKLESWFGLPLPKSQLLIAPLSGQHDGSGGAYHYGCGATTLYCDDDQVDDGSTTLALFVAELSEVGQDMQAAGWDCGASPGEALSRLHAETAHPGVLDGYSTAASWLDQNPRPDWITRADPTDQDAVSTGCGVLFLYWLLSRGATVAEITRAGGATLAATYASLGLGLLADAWKTFKAAVEAQWPSGQPSEVKTDNPWGVAPPPPPPPPPPPVPQQTTIVVSYDLPAGTYIMTRKG